MSYTGRKKKYTSRQQRASNIKRNTKMTIWITLIFLVILIYYKWVDIIDYLGTFFR